MFENLQDPPLRFTLLLCNPAQPSCVFTPVKWSHNDMGTFFLKWEAALHTTDRASLNIYISVLVTYTCHKAAANTPISRYLRCSESFLRVGSLSSCSLSETEPWLLLVPVR